MAKTTDWKTLVQEADKQGRDEKPVVYEFSKGRKFKERKDPYESAKN